MTNREIQKQELNKYTKEQIIEALIESPIAAGFVIEKCANSVKEEKKGGKKNG